MLEEIEFFIKKRDHLILQNETLLIEKQQLSVSALSDQQRKLEIERSVAANTLSVGFFERQISTALHDFRMLEVNDKRRCLLKLERKMSLEEFKEFSKLHKETEGQRLLL